MLSREYIPMTDNCRDALIAVCILWTFVASVLFLRLLGRYRGVGIGGDDILALVGLLLCAGEIPVIGMIFVSGCDYNFDPMIPEFPKVKANTEYLMQMTFAYTMLYIWTLAALKSSQLWFYFRAFSIQLTYWIYAVAGTTILWSIIFTFTFIFLCNPIKQQWTVQRIGHCMDQILVLKCLIMTNVITDLFIVILPIHTVWNLQMRKTEKLAVISCFALGLGCCAIGGARFWQIYAVDLTGNLSGTSLVTFTLCTVELKIACLCISIPILRPFYLKWRQLSRSSQKDIIGTSAYSKALHGARLAGGQGKSATILRGSNWDQETIHDNSSSQQLTPGPQPETGIHVSKNWAVTHSAA